MDLQGGGSHAMATNCFLTACSGDVESFGVSAMDGGFEAPLSPESLDVYALERWDVSPFCGCSDFCVECPTKDHPSLYGIFRIRTTISQAICGRLISSRA